jgi:hypothetical protein
VAATISYNSQIYIYICVLVFVCVCVCVCVCNAYLTRVSDILRLRRTSSMVGGVGGGGMGLGSTTYVCLFAHQECVWFDIFLVTLHGLRQNRIVSFGVGVTAMAGKVSLIHARTSHTASLCYYEYNEWSLEWN